MCMAMWHIEFTVLETGLYNAVNLSRCTLQKFVNYYIGIQVNLDMYYITQAKYKSAVSETTVSFKTAIQCAFSVN